MLFTVIYSVITYTIFSGTVQSPARSSSLNVTLRYAFFNSRNKWNKVNTFYYCSKSVYGKLKCVFLFLSFNCWQKIFYTFRSEAILDDVVRHISVFCLDDLPGKNLTHVYSSFNTTFSTLISLVFTYVIKAIV